MTDQLQDEAVVAHRYRIVRYRGDRGFGQVYEAHDSAMDGRVSVMRLDREFSHPRVRESFFETRSTAQVEDPRVVDFIDYGEDLDGRLFLVMPWVEGAVGLDSIDTAMPWPRIKAIIEQVAGALTAAHAKGVIHGGLGLSRVLVDPADAVHVVDFGLAPALTRPAGQPVTNVSPLAGNTAYLSPEQVADETPDARADVYALAVMLWELVSGAPPFVGNPIEVANAHLTRALPELNRRGAPAEIEALLHFALTKNRDERLATAEEFSLLLQAMPGHSEVASRPSVSRTPTTRIAATKPASAGAPTILSSPASPPPRTVAAPEARQQTTPLAPAIKPPSPPPPPPPAPAVLAGPPPAPSEPATPGAIDPPHPEDSATQTRPAIISPPPAKPRRFGKLQLAIVAFLCFGLLLFAASRLLVDDRESHEVPIAQAKPDREPDANPSGAPGSIEPVHTPEEPEPERSASEPASVEEALADALAPAPISPGPTRPLSQSLSDKDFRETMVDAREDILDSCLDTRMRRTLKVSLKVAPTGEVSFARVVGGLSDTQLGRCVVKQVYRVEFPPTHAGGSHVYTLRLR